MELQQYKDFRPTSFDPKGINIGCSNAPAGDWYLVPLSRTRDSEILEESNFNAALELLGGESETVEVHRFGHWGPGWFEIIVVHPTRITEVETIAEKLESYPVLDDEDLSRREYEDHEEYHVDYWSSDCSLCERAQSDFESMVRSAYNIALNESLRKAARIYNRWPKYLKSWPSPVAYFRQA